jgi:predicted O-linked N-acetylglucosamine transferase (SPINDLY family)
VTSRDKSLDGVLAESLAKFGPLPLEDCQRFLAVFRQNGIAEYADAMSRHLERRSFHIRRPRPAGPPGRIKSLSFDSIPDETRNAVFTHLFREQRPKIALQLARTLLAEEAGGDALAAVLGLALLETGSMLLAERALRPLMTRMPRSLMVATGMAKCLIQQRRFAEAADCATAALAIRPNHVQAMIQLAVARRDLGDRAGMFASLRNALTVDPENRAALAFLLYAQANEPTISHEEQRRFAENFRRTLPPAKQLQRPPLKERGDGLVRAGFVSGDFGVHPVGYFLAGFLGCLAQCGIETELFSTNRRADRITDRLRADARAYHEISGMDDAAAARLIVSRDIDILFDLSGHTKGGRLPVFALRPAPVQASYLGYHGTTGLPEIDFIVGDEIVTPMRNATHFVERIQHVEGGYVTFLPDAEGVAAEGSPVADHGYVTFGCFGRMEKAGAKVMEAWLEILAAMPRSRLLLKNSKWMESESLAALKLAMAARGMAPETLGVEGNSAKRDYYAAYNRVDVILDTFPYMGATTTAEALAMGVPVVALRGDHMASSLGASVLTAAGFGELVSTNTQDYIATAVRTAQSVTDGTWTKQAVRARADASGFFDGAKFAPRFARAIREMIAIVRDETGPGGQGR